MIAIGAQYYRPPNPPAADWADDLRRMRDNGFDTVKFWACWSWMQPAPDRIDFGDLDRLMDLAADCHLQVVINTILENAPYWLEQAHPEGRYRDADDRPVRLTAAMNTPGGGWPGLCFDNPPVADAAHQFLTRLAARYRDHPALRMWDVWNEPHLEPASYFPERMYCYCPGSLAGFQRWLMDHYESLGSLNETWARRYTDWTQVAPPRQFEAVPDLLDWRAYWFANLSRWLAQRAAVMHAADPEHDVMTHVALSGFTGQLATHTLDEFTLTGPVDVFGTSSFPTWLMGDDPVEHLFNLDAARDAAAGKPFWQAELQGGRGRREGLRSTPHPGPDVLHLWMWNAYASGASGVMFWQWRPELLGPEAPGYGLRAPDGGPTRRSGAAARFAEVMSGNHLTPWHPDPPSAALIVSRRTALLAYATDRTMDLYAQAVLGAYRMLSDGDVPVAILHEDQIEADGVPGHLTRLYWPMPAVSGDRLAAALAAFVQRGGSLLAEAGPGEYTLSGWRRPRLPFAELFGIRAGEADACGTVPVNLRDGGTLTGTWQRDSIAPVSAEVLGSFPDGTPAVTANRLGRGAAIRLGTVPSLAYYGTQDRASRLAISHLLGAEPQCRTARFTQPQPGLITRPGKLADGRRGVIALNWSARPQEIEVCESSLAVSSSHTGAARRTASPGELIELASHAALLVLTGELPVGASAFNRLDQQRDPAADAAGQAAGDHRQHGGHARAVVDGEVAVLVHARLVLRLASGVPHGEQPVEAELQRRLVRLVPAADRVVAVRASRHLDVAAKYVADPPGGGERGEPVQAGGERRRVLHVQPSRVHGVAGEQEAGALVVDGDRRVLVARRAGDLQSAPAEVVGQHLGGPAGEAEVSLHVAQPTADDPGVRPAGEVAVAGHVVAVPVGVRYDQLVAGCVAFSVAEQRIHGLPDAAAGRRSGVEQDRPPGAAQQVQEGRLVVHVLALPHDERVVIDADHLHLRVGGPAWRRSVDPPHVGQRIALGSIRVFYPIRHAASLGRGQDEHRDLPCGAGLVDPDSREPRDQRRPECGAGDVVQFLCHDRQR